MQMKPLRTSAAYRHLHSTRFPPWLRNGGSLVQVGEWGCALSHCDYWQHVVLAYRPALIFEDDIALSIQPSQAREMIDATVKKYTDADIIFLGHWKKFLTTHAYYVTPNGAKRLLQECRPASFHIPTPIDRYVKKLCETGEVRCAQNTS